MFLVCGEAVIDFFQDTRGPIAFNGQAAGSPFNVAVGLRRLGAKAAMMTGLSTDPFGRRLIEAMESEGIDWSLAPRTDRPTILSFVMVKPDGGPEYAFYGENGADLQVPPGAIPWPLPATVRGVHVGGFPMAVEPARSSYADLIRRAGPGLFVSLDPNVRPSLMGDLTIFRAHFEDLCRHAALIKASSEDVGHLYPGVGLAEVAALWLERGAGAIVLTDGPNGAQAFNAAGVVAAKTRPVAVVDTVGAGDSFMSALLAEIEVR
ncbi:MAG: carbohydrate kinase family protein, partial [Beijerinckiaceae bacterium]